MKAMEGTFSMTFIVLKEFSIYGLEVSSGILSSISRWIHSNFFMDSEFELGGRSKSRRGKIKKSLKNITLIANLPLFVGTGSTKGGKNCPNYLGWNSS